MQATIHHVATHYQDMGKGPVVILLHGWGCDWQIWGPLIPELTKQYRVVIPDLPAFGKSALPKQIWDSQEYATWLAGFITEISTQPVIIVGHSFGGKIAALFAAQHPERVSLLVLTGASGIPDPLTPQQHIQQLLLSFIPETLKAQVPATLRLRLLQRAGAATDHFNSNPVQRQIMKKIVRENIVDELKRIITPTLLIWGENDTDTPLHQGKVFAKHISGAQLATIPQAGHFAYLDQPHLFLQTLSTFLP